jgi:hypothetical protein
MGKLRPRLHQLDSSQPEAGDTQMWAATDALGPSHRNWARPQHAAAAFLDWVLLVSSCVLNGANPGESFGSRRDELECL